MTGNTFFLGLGGQKCGSTWIRDYLARQPGSDFGRLGEYQVWEPDLGGVFNRYRVPTPSQFDQLRARLKRALGAAEPANHLRWRLQSDRGAYFDYFASLLDRPGILRSGDITPSYAALPEHALRRIAHGMAAKGIDTRALFSMRDPVARLASHLRMDMAKGRLPRAPISESLAQSHDTPEPRARSRYDETIAALDAVFAPEALHLTLFEELFTPDGITRLAAFADVEADLGAGGTAVNARGAQDPIPEALEARIAAYYAPVYTAVIDRLPQAAWLWPSARHL